MYLFLTIFSSVQFRYDDRRYANVVHAGVPSVVIRKVSSINIDTTAQTWRGGGEAARRRRLRLRGMEATRRCWQGTVVSALQRGGDDAATVPRRRLYGDCNAARRQAALVEQRHVEVAVYEQ